MRMEGKECRKAKGGGWMCGECDLYRLYKCAAGVEACVDVGVACSQGALSLVWLQLRHEPH